MGRKRTPGLIERNGIWHIDKSIHGRRMRRSCKTGSLSEAEAYLALMTEEVRQASLYGVRPEVSFEAAAAKYVLENRLKKSLRNDINRLQNLMPWIGSMPIHRIHQGTLDAWKEHRLKEGKAAGTINHGIKVVNRILNLAATDWINEYGLTWLDRAPKLKLLPDQHKRQPYPLSWDEQRRLLAELPDHLVEMSLFAVNTGCRDQEVCNLQWEWEVSVPELDTSVFIIPGEYTKNGDDRLVVLNRIAASVVEACRGRHDRNVFTYKGEPTTRMMNKAWLRARNSAGLPSFRVHDLKHTYGRRLRSAGVSFEDRQDLLGHRSHRITTHYSAPELTQLIEMSNLVCDQNGEKPQLVVLRRSGVG
jgi:integrase